MRRYSELGTRRGWDLVVMYGQTEATARMAYLPPSLAFANPSTIGVPVPGGEFRIDPVPGLADGELVYSGPNVMLGYATSPDDLAAGRTVHELRTGDLARQHANGLYEVVGRRNRFLKIVGLRIDLGQVESILSGLGVASAAAGSDERIVIAVEGSHDARLLAKILSENLGLPRAALHVQALERLPRLSNGKVDYPAVQALAQVPDDTPAAAAIPSSNGRDDARTIFAETLELENIEDHDTFVSLGGDSLSYVAASIRLEKALGYLPADWHLTPVRDLTPRQQPALRVRRLLAPLETGIVLRAVGIILIVGTHVGLFSWPGRRTCRWRRPDSTSHGSSSRANGCPG